MAEAAQDQDTVTPDALDTALESLTKALEGTQAADALVKGGQVYSGVSDERGKVSEGSSPDAGKIDSLMIGKMIGRLVNTGVLAAGPNMAGFANGQFGNDDEDGDGDNDEDDEEMRGAMTAFRTQMKGLADAGFFKSEKVSESNLRKSFIDEVGDDPEVREAIDASPFMQQLVDATASAIGKLEKSHASKATQQDTLIKATARAVVEVGTMFKSLNERLGIVEQTPNAPKGATSLSGARALQKSLAGVGAGQSTLKKAHMLNVMSYMNLVKGIKSIGGRPSVETISKLDSANEISPEAVEEVGAFLTSNEGEALKAINYRA